MLIEIIQPENDKTNYLERIASFLTDKVKTMEQLEQRFDCLMTEFAMNQPFTDYDAKQRKLTVS
ncbi:MAG: hypothetical protein KAS32_10670 [Candidatus Peribacteraceae bacterium]|nr:hypothetical protein [Candidatus Peribacteraceae bacterium]